MVERRVERFAIQRVFLLYRPSWQGALTTFQADTFSLERPLAEVKQTDNAKI